MHVASGPQTSSATKAPHEGRWRREMGCLSMCVTLMELEKFLSKAEYIYECDFDKKSLHSHYAPQLGAYISGEAQKLRNEKVCAFSHIFWMGSLCTLQFLTSKYLLNTHMDGPAEYFSDIFPACGENGAKVFAKRKSLSTAVVVAVAEPHNQNSRLLTCWVWVWVQCIMPRAKYTAIRICTFVYVNIDLMRLNIFNYCAYDRWPAANNWIKFISCLAETSGILP